MYLFCLGLRCPCMEQDASPTCGRWWQVCDTNQIAAPFRFWIGHWWKRRQVHGGFMAPQSLVPVMYWPRVSTYMCESTLQPDLS